jgi:cytochrome c biogenesis protein CcmG/thiol:disulfide interchange protein DsbE
MASPGQANAATPRGVNPGVLVAGLFVVVPLLVVLFVNLGRDPHSIASPMLGTNAPAFTLTPVGGGLPVSLARLAGKPVVINFWASWCIPCLEEHGVLTSTARQLGSEVQLLGVVYQDEETAIQAFLSRRGSAYPTLLDPEGRTAIAYGVYGVPETYFIDRGGRIVAKFVGPLTPASLAENLQKAGL